MGAIAIAPRGVKKRIIDHLRQRGVPLLWPDAFANAGRLYEIG